MQRATADVFRADMEAKLAQRPDLQDKSTYLLTPFWLRSLKYCVQLYLTSRCVAAA